MKLFFRQFGQGKPIIILHGLFGLSDNWVSIAKELALNYKVILPDLRNHGLSPKSSVMNYDVMSEDLLELIYSVDLKDIILIGHSMGGKVAMKYCLENSEKVEKLIVVDIGPKKYTIDHKDILEAFNSVDFSTMNTREKIEIQLKKYVPNNNVRQLIMKNLFWKSKNCLAWKLNIEAINNNFEKILEEITSNNTFTKPTLFLKGEFSDYILNLDKKEIFLLFPSSKFEEIQNASHWVHFDSRNDFIKSVKQFINL
jgi:pimeloyl-ACP methyl ester carboxylesterase